MKVLITGGSSLLGKALIETVPEGHTIEATWYTNYVYRSMYQMDISNQSQVRYIFDRVKPKVIIHCAGNGSVDYAEQNYTEAVAVNVNGTRNVLRAAADYEAKVIYISTNAVFSGDNPPYAENTERKPVNAYGSIKRQAEELVKESRHWVIIRPHLLYGWPWTNGRGNWGMYAVQQLSQGKRLKVVSDKVTHPLYVVSCAEAIWQLIEKDEEIFNIAGADVVSLYEFVKMVAKVWDFDEGLIEPVGSDTFKMMAPRPDDTHYDLSKIYSLGIKPSGIEEGLTRMKAACMLTEDQ